MLMITVFSDMTPYQFVNLLLCLRIWLCAWSGTTPKMLFGLQLEEVAITLNIYQSSRPRIPEALIRFQLLQVTAGAERFIPVYVRIYYVCVVIFFAFSRTEARCLIQTLHYTSCNVTFITYTVLHNLKNEQRQTKPTSELISSAVTLNFVVRKLHQVGSRTDFICKPIATLNSFLMFTSMFLMFICRHMYNLCWLVYMLSSILFLHAFPISPRTWCPLSFLSAPFILYHHPLI